MGKVSGHLIAGLAAQLCVGLHLDLDLPASDLPLFRLDASSTSPIPNHRVASPCRIATHSHRFHPTVSVAALIPLTSSAWIALSIPSNTVDEFPV
ncbi:hypothetical protein VTJ04DRAFT_8152 [Mycothermus thermophilus]|uniref:uncharacterized protein n=1 Tax=Humicola insolens TaxID=85995 RepID=UPI003742D828